MSAYSEDETRPQRLIDTVRYYNDEYTISSIIDSPLVEKIFNNRNNTEEITQELLIRIEDLENTVESKTEEITPQIKELLKRIEDLENIIRDKEEHEYEIINNIIKDKEERESKIFNNIIHLQIKNKNIENLLDEILYNSVCNEDLKNRLEILEEKKKELDNLVLNMMNI